MERRKSEVLPRRKLFKKKGAVGKNERNGRTGK
jgi:hypothetical protein